MSDDYTNPVAQFQQLMATVSAPSDPAALEPDALNQVIAGAPDNTESALADHIAKNSRLDRTESLALVQKSLPAEGTPMEKATAVSKATTAAAGLSGDVQFSNPVMLKPSVRLAFSAVLGAALILTIIFIYALGRQQTAAPTATYICLAVSGGLSLLGLLILVMGYKNVTIKGSK